MSDDEKNLEKLLDVLVYAPLGLALEAKELIPQLAERGRGQVALMRLAQKVAAQRAAAGDEGQAGGAEQVRSAVLEALDTLCAWLGGEGSTDAEPGTDAEAGGDAVPDGEPEHAAESTETAEASEAASTETEQAELPYAAYDDQTAREIIADLGMRGPAKLRQILAYEQQNRARSTVLNRVARLLE